MKAPYPMPKQQPYSGEKVKELFAAAGVSVSDWSAANGYNRQTVYMVINGQFRARRGRVHEIALKLGMKLPAAMAA